MSGPGKQDERSNDEGLNDNGNPALSREDFQDIGDPDLQPSDAPSNGDLRFEDDDPSGELPGEDDDNEYQESDEALPDDEEERAIARNPGREGGRFDEG